MSGTTQRATAYRSAGLLASVIAGARRRGQPTAPPTVRRQRLARIREINQEITALNQGLAQMPQQQQQQMQAQVNAQIQRLQNELQQLMQQI